MLWNKNIEMFDFPRRKMSTERDVAICEHAIFTCEVPDRQTGTFVLAKAQLGS